MPGHGDQAGVMDANGICLPSDLLLDILRRLPGRALAVSRSICRAWRDLVGAHTHTLLLPQVFPRKFPGVFAHYYGYDPDLPSLFGEEEPTEEEQHDSQSESEEVQAAEATKENVFHVFVFSSDTGQWESCQLTHCHSGVLMVLRCSEGTYDMVQLPGHPREDERLSQWALPKSYLGSYHGGIRYAVISELQLEVHHLTELAGDPLGWTLACKADLKEHDRTVNYMRRQERMEPKMRWSVVESSKDLITLFEDNNEESNADCDDGNGKEGEEEEEGMDEQEEEEAQQEEDSDEEKPGDQHAQLESSDGSDYSWNSDEHNFIEFDNSEIADEHVWGWGCNIVGFHPYKDAILIEFSGRVVVYHLHTSRMQYLGDIYPRQHHDS